jgi:hypothetical protein
VSNWYWHHNIENSFMRYITFCNCFIILIICLENFIVFHFYSCDVVHISNHHPCIGMCAAGKVGEMRCRTWKLQQTVWGWNDVRLYMKLTTNSGGNATPYNYCKPSNICLRKMSIARENENKTIWNENYVSSIGHMRSRRRTL